MRKNLRSQIRNGLEVISLSACGYSDRQIAVKLHLAPETIRSRMKAFYTVVRARNRHHALAIAITNGWLEAGELWESIHNLQPEKLKKAHDTGIS